MSKVQEKKITRKQRVFVEAYIKTWNAAEAARQAAYAYPEKQGPRLLTFVGVKEYLQQRMQAMSMEADEVLERLTQQAQCNAADFFNFAVGDDGSVEMVGINWEAFQKQGHLVKSVKNIKGKWTIEFYDAQAALVQIGKALRLFTEQVDLNTNTSNVLIYIPDNGRGDHEPDQH